MTRNNYFYNCGIVEFEACDVNDYNFTNQYKLGRSFYFYAASLFILSNGFVPIDMNLCESLFEVCPGKSVIEILFCAETNV